ncbi:MAG: lipid-A-disaccharide synthase [Vicinamibacterales bacterium]|jgi:lipid-A-disaccharide synthase|nr:lipid-A-disaccharide synthase [Vicinamibacterales bacterium]MDP6607484.1 lipid-A-disaccharide synthase [Vicinamibacterales bacterium]|tara:strand:+ start:175 stop:1323 length:1149 start_codon:yes stop_codon:yes gene_type:complete
MPKVLISCGETSGDMYAAALTTELMRLAPSARVTGLGGDRLAAAGARLVSHYRGLSVTGLVEALAVLPRSWTIYRALVAAMRRDRPDVVVAVDFPDFNFRLAAAARRFGVPVVYYVSPQVWAWRRGRLRTLARLVDLMLVIFPFEEAVYREVGIPVEFVGHPLIELARTGTPRAAWLSELGFAPDAPTVALLPGSRANEVGQLLPLLLDAVRAIVEQVPAAQFIVARAPGLDDGLFERAEAWEGPGRVSVVEGRTDDALSVADVVATASGTATIQAAIHGRPMVIIYRVAPLTYALGKRFVHVDTYGMVNLVAGESVVPELIQDQCTPGAIAAEVVGYLTNDERMRQTRASLDEVRTRLGGAGASRRAAEAVLAVANRSATS